MKSDQTRSVSPVVMPTVERHRDGSATIGNGSREVAFATDWQARNAALRLLGFESWMNIEWGCLDGRCP